ncbi:serine/threonine-protein kinase [Micromonospora coxensis]|uniref:serine/threonine-protein kinase n=1 Tax=Micromonospora coxensis TaxID=356852 RepID=UPI001E5F08D2|nr:serine/threonine-protein kinase [Micromonospora coxensis]
MLTQGVVLSNRYRLSERVATGGMGAVWRCVDTLLDREVAVKVLLPSLVEDPEFTTRFHAEARMMAALRHPGIVAVHDFGSATLADGSRVSYLVMEYVDGEPLVTWVRRAGRLDPASTMSVVAQAAAALHAAHTAGIVHRDVKPGNLLVKRDGTVVLVDFGIARSSTMASLTAAHMVLGTASYMSPEQATGQPVSAATDVYALGAVAYYCLAGQPPFAGENPLQVALRHAQDEPAPLPAGTPPAVAAVIARALAKSPGDRWPSAAALADGALDARDATLAVLAAPPRPPWALEGPALPVPSVPAGPPVPSGASPSGTPAEGDRSGGSVAAGPLATGPAGALPGPGAAGALPGAEAAGALPGPGAAGALPGAGVGAGAASGPSGAGAPALPGAGAASGTASTGTGSGPVAVPGGSVPSAGHPAPAPHSGVGHPGPAVPLSPAGPLGDRAGAGGAVPAAGAAAPWGGPSLASGGPDRTGQPGGPGHPGTGAQAGTTPAQAGVTPGVVAPPWQQSGALAAPPPGASAPAGHPSAPPFTAGGQPYPGGPYPAVTGGQQATPPAGYPSRYVPPESNPTREDPAAGAARRRRLALAGAAGAVVAVLAGIGAVVALQPDEPARGGGTALPEGSATVQAPQPAPEASGTRSARPAPTASVTGTRSASAGPTAGTTGTAGPRPGGEPSAGASTGTAPQPGPTTTGPQRKNPYTPAQVCGSGYQVVDSATLTSGGVRKGRVYLLWNGSTKANCVVTMKETAVGERTTVSAYLEVQGKPRSTDSGAFEYYAGPVRAAAAGICVKWGGATGGASYGSGFEHCG